MNYSKTTSVVYEVTCHDRDFVCIEQTKRELKSRKLEHQRAIKFQRFKKSAFYQHLTEIDHVINWSELFKIKKSWK